MQLATWRCNVSYLLRLIERFMAKFLCCFLCQLVVDNIQHYKLFGWDFDMVSRINLTVKDGLVTSHQDL